MTEAELAYIEDGTNLHVKDRLIAEIRRLRAAEVPGRLQTNLGIDTPR